MGNSASTPSQNNKLFTLSRSGNTLTLQGPQNILETFGKNWWGTLPKNDYRFSHDNCSVEFNLSNIAVLELVIMFLNEYKHSDKIEAVGTWLTLMQTEQQQQASSSAQSSASSSSSANNNNNASSSSRSADKASDIMYYVTILPDTFILHCNHRILTESDYQQQEKISAAFGEVQRFFDAGKLYFHSPDLPMLNRLRTFILDMGEKGIENYAEALAKIKIFIELHLQSSSSSARNKDTGYTVELIDNRLMITSHDPSIKAQAAWQWPQQASLGIANNGQTISVLLADAEILQQAIYFVWELKAHIVDWQPVHEQLQARLLGMNKTAASSHATTSATPTRYPVVPQMRASQSSSASSSSSASAVIVKKSTNQARLDAILAHSQFAKLLENGIALPYEEEKITTQAQFDAYIIDWEDIVTLRMIDTPVILPGGRVMDAQSFEDNVRGNSKNPVEKIPDGYNPPPALQVAKDIEKFLSLLEKKLSHLASVAVLKAK